MSLNFFFKKIAGQLRKWDDRVVSQPFTFAIHYHAFIRRHTCLVLVKSFGNLKGANSCHLQQNNFPCHSQKITKIIIIRPWQSDAQQSVIFVIEWGHPANAETFRNVGFFFFTICREVMVRELYNKLEWATGKLSRGSQLIPVTCWLAH